MKVDTSLWSEEARDAFIEGWEDAGGTMDDLESSTPWCCPWEWEPVIDVHSKKPYDMGKEFWRQLKPEIEREQERYRKEMELYDDED